MTDHDNQRNILKGPSFKRKPIKLQPIRSYGAVEPTPEPVTPSEQEQEQEPQQSSQQAQETHQPATPPPPTPVTPSASKRSPGIVTEQEIQKQKAEMQQKLETEMATYRQKLIDEAENERKAILDGAHKEGYDKGVEEGKQELKAKAQELHTAINQLAVDRTQNLRKAEKEILDLAMVVAKKVIQTELETNTEQFSSIFEESLARVTQKDQVIIKVNSSDAPTIRNYIEAHKKQLNDIKRLEVYEDADIETGGCVIETKLGYIDSSISTKLDLISHAIDEEFEQYVVDTAQATPTTPEPEQHPEPEEEEIHLEDQHDEDFEVDEIEAYDDEDDAPGDLEFDDLEIDDF